MKFKKVGYDFIANIFASGVMTFALQIIVYPYYAKILDVNTYGMILTIMGLVNLLSASIGNGLNNVRLLNSSKASCKGDYNILILIFSSITFLVMFCISNYFNFNMLSCFIMALTTLIGALRQYYSVTYRLNISFNKLLICNSLIALGYVIGCCISFTNKDLWSISFLLGEILGFIYCIKSSNLIKEPFKITNKFKNVSKMYIHLIISTLCAQLVLYVDRFFILPILGSAYVSIYTIAAFPGKTLGIVMIPISSVILSYYSKEGFQLTLGYIKKINILIYLSSIFLFLITIIFSPFVISLLYPDMYIKSTHYINLASLGAVLNIITSMLQPALLKVAPSYWQIYLQLLYISLFFILAYPLTKLYGLYGVCLSIIISNLFKIVLTNVLCRKYIKIKN